MIDCSQLPFDVDMLILIVDAHKLDLFLLHKKITLYVVKVREMFNHHLSPDRIYAFSINNK